MSVQDTAKVLEISESLVYRLMRQRTNRLETIDFAGRVLVETDSIEAEKARRDAAKAEVAA